MRSFVLARNVNGTSPRPPFIAVLCCICCVSSLPAAAQSPMAPGRPAISPPPRVDIPAPRVDIPTPRAPQAPVLTPQAPVVPGPAVNFPGGGSGNARGGISENESPRPTDRSTSGSANARASINLQDFHFLRSGSGNHRPVPGVGVVSISKMGNSIKMSSDQNGVFRFGELTPGVHDVQLYLKIKLEDVLVSSVRNAPAPTGPDASQPKPIAILVSLLLPAVQKVRDGAPSSSAPNPALAGPTLLVQRSFPLNTMVARLTITIPEDGSSPRVAWANVPVVGDYDGDGREELVSNTPGREEQAAGRVVVVTSGGPADPGAISLNFAKIEFDYGARLAGADSVLPAPSVNGTAQGKHFPKTSVPTISGHKFSTGEDGMFRLGQLGPGNYEVVLDLKGAYIYIEKTTLRNERPTGESRVLVSLLLPAVQKARERLARGPGEPASQDSRRTLLLQRSFPLKTTMVRLSITVPEDGSPARVAWGGGVAAGDVDGDGIRGTDDMTAVGRVAFIR